MKYYFKILMLFIILIFNTSRGQQAGYVVIAEIYGGGGNSGAYYKNDFILLYNPTASSVSLNGWSVQYAAATSSSWSLTNLSGSISAGGYYLIQEDTGTGGSADLPTPNISGSIAMSATAGKVALVNSTTALSGTNAVTDPSVVDFVGYGGTANEFETAAAPAPSNSASIRRKDNSENSNSAGFGSGGSGWDSNNNSSDFTVATLSISNTTLPVEFTSFIANIFNSSVQLKWQTATEVNNYGFEVERLNPPHNPLPGGEEKYPSHNPLPGGEEKYPPLSPLPGGEKKGWVKIGFVNGNGNSSSTKDYTFIDPAIGTGKNISSGKYSYRLKQIDNNGAYKYSNVVEVSFMKPAKFALEQNYPNPFNPSTTISFSIPIYFTHCLKLYDVLGREVQTLINENRKAGTHNINFYANNLSNGVYMYKLTAGNYSEIKKMILLK
ncbi:MAG: lamin tail domain-containing protein [Bacteroidetes bacterium]|nr:lamin tail domain-containing protein [Bacteroidota bacterium]